VVDRLTGAIVVDSERPQLGMHPLGHTDSRYFPLVGLEASNGLLTHDGLRMAYLRMPRGAANANNWVVVASSRARESDLIGLNRATLALLGLLLALVALPIAYRWGRLNKDLTEREHDLDQSQRRYRVLFEEAEAGRRLLAEQNDRLRHLDRMKDDFVASVSHELRTPLTSINGYVELLVEGDAGQVNEEQASFLGVIRRNGERLLRVVGDLCSPRSSTRARWSSSARPATSPVCSFRQARRHGRLPTSGRSSWSWRPRRCRRSRAMRDGSARCSTTSSRMRSSSRRRAAASRFASS